MSTQFEQELEAVIKRMTEVIEMQTQTMSMLKDIVHIRDSAKEVLLDSLTEDYDPITEEERMQLSEAIEDYYSDFSVYPESRL